MYVCMYVCMYIYMYQFLPKNFMFVNILNPTFILVMLLTALARLVQGEMRK